ncbi:MATE family efflux transporter [Chloroflexota bacterium]
MKKHTQNVLDDDRVGRLLLRLSLPAFMGMFVMTLYNVIDTIFIGHYVGSLGIAGLSIVFPVQMLSLGIGQMMGMGGASLISRLLGARNIPRAEHAVGNAVVLSAVLAVIMTVVGLSNTNFWLRLMGSSESILPYARDYMTIIVAGIIFPTVSITLNSLVRAEGNARVAMTAMIVGAVSNIILDAVFIISLDMGIRGAALATLIAQLMSLVYLVSFYISGNSYLKIYFRNMMPDFGILKAILSIGVSSFARTMAASLSVILINRMLIVYGGDYAVSAFGIINRIMMFAVMPGLTVGQGLQPILGFNYGARRFDRALRVLKIAITAATVICFGVFLLLYLAPEPIIRIFTADETLVAMASHAARRVFLALYLIGFIMVGSLFFQSIGKARLSFVTSIARPFLFMIPLLFILSRFWQLEGIWLALPISEVLTFLLTLILFIPQVRKLKRAGLSLTGKVVGVKDESIIGSN